MILKKLGAFLLNLILTNRRETLPGQTVTEVEKTSALFGLNLNDFARGMTMAVLGAVVGDLIAMVDAGDMVIDWSAIKKGAIIAGLAYLKLKFVTPSKTILKLIVLGLLFSVPAFAQNNATVKAIQSWNADSTTVRALANLDSIMGRETGWLYFNNVTRKWRLGIATPDSVTWYDIGTGSGTGGGLVNFATNGLHLNADSVALGGTLWTDAGISGDNVAGISFTDMTSFSTTTADGSYFSVDGFGGSGIAGFTHDGYQLAAEGGIQFDSSPGNISFSGNEYSLATVGQQLFSVNGSNKLTINTTILGGSGVKFVPQPSGTTPGLTVGTIGGNPSAPANGDLWYNLSTNQMVGRINGANGNIATVAGNSVGQVQYYNSGYLGATSSMEFIASSNLLRIANTNNLSNGGSITVGNTGTVGNVSNVTLFANSGGTAQSLINSATSTGGVLGARVGASITSSAFDLLISASGNGNGSPSRIILNPNAGGYVIINNLPTSCAGAPTGALANIAGVLNVCP